MALIKKMWKDDEALSPIIEWALGVAFVALIAAPVIGTIAHTVATKLNTINTDIQNAGTA